MDSIGTREYPAFLADFVLRGNPWFDVEQCEVYKVRRNPDLNVGLLSVSDLQACRDVKLQALEDASLLENHLQEHDWKINGMKEFLELRSKLGLNEHNVAKLQLEKEPIDVGRLRHLLFLKLYAFKPLLTAPPSSGIWMGSMMMYFHLSLICP
jgi:hypothetical protein